MELPEYVTSCLTKLTYLDLNGNLLDSLPDNISEVSGGKGKNGGPRGQHAGPHAMQAGLS